MKRLFSRGALPEVDRSHPSGSFFIAAFDSFASTKSQRGSRRIFLLPLRLMPTLRCQDNTCRASFAQQSTRSVASIFALSLTLAEFEAKRRRGSSSKSPAAIWTSIIARDGICRSVREIGRRLFVSGTEIGGTAGGVFHRPRFPWRAGGTRALASNWRLSIALWALGRIGWAAEARGRRAPRGRWGTALSCRRRMERPCWSAAAWEFPRCSTWPSALAGHRRRCSAGQPQPRSFPVDLGAGGWIPQAGKRRAEFEHLGIRRPGITSVISTDDGRYGFRGSRRRGVSEKYPEQKA